MSHWIVAIGLGSATGVFLLSKSLFLAPFPAGRALLLANLVYEVAERKLRMGRLALDAILWVALVAGFGWWGGSAAAATAAVLLGLAWVGYLHADSESKAGRSAKQNKEWAGRVPLPIPRLIISIRGPILERRRSVDDERLRPARITFSVGRAGNLLSASLAASSGHAGLDAAALAKVRRAAPFPPVPDGAQAPLTLSLPVVIRLD